MKFSCTQENLHRALQIASRLTGKDTGLPILSHVVLRSKEGAISIHATNLEVGVSCTVRGKIEKEGEVAIEAKVITDYVSFLPHEVVTIESNEEGVVRIVCQNFSTSIRGTKADDFPIIPLLEKEQVFTMAAKDTKRAISRVVFACKYDESRPELSGVYVHYKGNNELVMAATDAYRLAEQKLGVQTNIQDAVGVIVPLKTMQEVLRIIDNDEEKLHVYLQESQILFVYQGIELISKVIEGQYPDYSQIIPPSFSTKAVIDTADFIKAIKVSSIFTKAGLNDVVLEFLPSDKGKGELKVASSNSTVGEQQTILPIGLSGDGNAVTLNYRYVLDGVGVLEGEQFSLQAIDNNSPCVITSLTDATYLYLVMPIRQ